MKKFGFSVLTLGRTKSNNKSQINEKQLLVLYLYLYLSICIFFFFLQTKQAVAKVLKVILNRYKFNSLI